MKKYLLVVAILFASLFARAQNNFSYVRNFREDYRSIESLVLDGNTCMLAVQTGRHKYDLTAIDYQMKTIWETVIEDDVVAYANLKGKILVVADARKKAKGIKFCWKGYLLDPKTGKILLEKELYQSASKYEEFAYALPAKDGVFFKLMIRTSGFKNRFGPQSINHYDASTSFTVLDISEQLEARSSFKPVADEGDYIGSAVDKDGNLYLASMLNKGQTLAVYRYDMKLPDTPVVMQQNINAKNDRGPLFFDDFKVILCPSADHKYIAYYGFVFKNASAQQQLNITKLDFATKTTSTYSKIIDKQYLKALKERPENTDDLSKLSFGDTFSYEVRYLNDESGSLISGVSGDGDMEVGDVSRPGHVLVQRPVIITAFNDDMSEKYLQIAPIYYWNPFLTDFNGYHIRNNNLRIVAGTVIYNMDIANGNWKQIGSIATKALNGDHPDGKRALRFDKGFVIPHVNRKAKVSLLQVPSCFRLS